MAESEVLRAPHVLEFPYKRSLGPVIGAFFTGLRDGRILGTRTPGGQVVVPPTEYDPETGQDTEPDLVEVGPGGVVKSWAWTQTRAGPAPRPAVRVGVGPTRWSRHLDAPRARHRIRRQVLDRDAREGEVQAGRGPRREHARHRVLRP